MARVAKVIELVGTSTKSWQNAVENALLEASKTVRNITGMEVTQMTKEVTGDRMTSWRATIRVMFGIEGEKRH